MSKKNEKDSIKLTLEIEVIKAEKNENENKRIACAPVLIPGVVKGCVIDSHTIEKAAHKALLEGIGVSTDHDGVPGKGEIVESWILKDKREFQLPDGSTKTYPKGTWMVCISFKEDVWQRIKNGELKGLSPTMECEFISLKDLP